jgi:hypothetical protein
MRPAIDGVAIYFFSKEVQIPEIYFRTASFGWWPDPSRKRLQPEGIEFATEPNLR